MTVTADSSGLRRVVVTGIGTVNPLGADARTSWEGIRAGVSGASAITHFETADLPCRIACQIPHASAPDTRRKAHLNGHAGFDPDEWMEPKERRKVDDFIVYAMAASEMALSDAGWRPARYDDQVRTGVLIGSGIGGLAGIEDGSHTLRDKGPRRLSPFFIPGRLINLASGYVSIRHGLKGPNHAVVTACSTGAHAIGDASRLIMMGDADVMLAGGTESPIGRLAVAGFSAARALSTGFNDTPEKASRPYDRDRDGFVMGEGAGVVVLEALDHALARGARIYAEVVGYGLSGDAYHITAPAPDGDGAFRCMDAALKRAGVDPSEVDYVNAHGTSTQLGDEIELEAVHRLLGNAAGRVKMSSTKSATGHLLGAAGAVEAIFTVLAIRDQVAPPTINLDNPSVETPIDLVAHAAKEADIRVALSNSFGFGGTNASLVFRALDS